MTIAITGGTGFVGAHLLRIAGARGLEVRALTRRPQPAAPGLTWIDGALDDPASLARLCEGADAVIHVAGVINAPDRAGFAAGNIAGTEAMLAAARDAGATRFVHVSSLAAREPGLSAYGWSKRESEALVTAAGLDTIIVRPPAIYGPGDREMLELFRLANRGFVPLPPGGRLSVIAADDLCALFLAALDAPPHALWEPDDGRPHGWTQHDFAEAIAHAVERRPLILPIPKPLLYLVAAIDRLARGPRAKLTRDRVRYFCHPDWTADPSRRPPPAVWRPRIDTAEGLRETARWYREAGWL